MSNVIFLLGAETFPVARIPLIKDLTNDFRYRLPTEDRDIRWQKAYPLASGFHQIWG